MTALQVVVDALHICKLRCALAVHDSFFGNVPVYCDFFSLIGKPEKLWLLILRIINQGTVLEILVLLYSRLVMTL